MRHARLMSLLLAAALLPACGAAGPNSDLALVVVPTQRPFVADGLTGCHDALLEGTLVHHEAAGVAVQFDANSQPTVVAWPHGYVAADRAAARMLLDGQGRVVARVGDWISAGGGFTPPEEWFHVCGDIRVTPAP